ncbi:MaoC family dehydratase [Isoptericola croceus]|uniref:MaoC family dehydratase n=1 Tax=Isoptericola croceus TaxID=3031406 RepID=UPI0023F95F24|nr:MaoC family dehydratase [Isoptericola croceus]
MSEVRDIIRVESPAALADAVGQQATGKWFTIDQHRIAAFADATEDHQWIHLDAERAKHGPFGTTIAHGFLTLSLLPRLTGELLEVGQTAMAVNYGLDKVRFLTPVAAGARVRATTEITGAETTAQGVRLASTVTIEIEGADKPALIAQTLSLYAPSA